MYYILDTNGKVTCQIGDAFVTAEKSITDFYSLGDTSHTQVDPPTTLLNPKFDGTNWVEDATAQEITDDLEAYREYYRSECYSRCQSKLNEIHGSVQAMFEHAAKWREANTIKNVVTKGPQALRDEAGTSNTPYIDEYIAEFGGTADAAADAIIAAEWVDAQKGAKIARYRKRAITDIDAATDRAGVDTAMTNLQTNLDTI